VTDTSPVPRADILARAEAAYLGLALGDALGATVEFMTPREIAHHFADAGGVHREITGGGWLHLKPGQVTDDTAWRWRWATPFSPITAGFRARPARTLSTSGCAASRWTSATRCGAT
jgi:hypothetical protein